MLAATATLVFLATLWVAARLAIDIIADDSAKIAAALAGRSLLSRQSAPVVEVSVRYQPRAAQAQRPVHAEPRWRAAA